MTEQQLRDGIVAILAADNTVQSLCERSTDLVVERNTPGLAPTIPVLVYEVPTFDEGQGAAELRLSALATPVVGGASGGSRARALREAAKAALTQPAFESHGLQVAPIKTLDFGVESVFELAGTPDLEQADATISLMVFES